MKHPYSPECHCDRCAKEQARRAAQSAANPQPTRTPAARRRTRRTTERRPAWGSAEWAETRGDDLGESPDR